MTLLMNACPVATDREFGLDLAEDCISLVLSAGHDVERQIEDLELFREQVQVFPSAAPFAVARLDAELARLRGEEVPEVMAPAALPPVPPRQTWTVCCDLCQQTVSTTATKELLAFWDFTSWGWQVGPQETYCPFCLITSPSKYLTFAF